MVDCLKGDPFDDEDEQALMMFAMERKIRRARGGRIAKMVAGIGAACLPAPPEQEEAP